jgi:ribosomal protein S18 acetylase RimI-like enzyme
MTTSNIRAAQESERSRVIAAIVAGFIADPVARWCWPDAESYLTNMGRFTNAYGGKAFRHGSAWTDSDFRGGALWLPPGEHPNEQELHDIVAATLGQRKQGFLLAALEECGSYHPDEPHWFLPLIAVDPSCQGKGIGSRLMEQAVAQCDATGTRAYLESSNPRNIPLYERHGFRVVGEVRHGDCPVFTPMLRDPR